MEASLPSIPRKARRTVVALVGTQWRVVECADAIQWIVQKRTGSRHGSARWDCRKYFRTRAALVAFCRPLASASDPGALSVLESLPGRIGQCADAGSASPDPAVVPPAKSSDR